MLIFCSETGLDHTIIKGKVIECREMVVMVNVLGFNPDQVKQWQLEFASSPKRATHWSTCGLLLRELALLSPSLCVVLVIERFVNFH